MKCKYCNTEIKEGVKFCPNCGKMVDTMIKCIHCGKLIKEGISYCPYCGSSQLGKQSDDTQKKDTPTENVKPVAKKIEPNYADKPEYQEFAIQILKYMRRSKSEKQIALYSNKYASTIEYEKEHGLNTDYAPFVFAEAIRKLETEKNTSIHHISAEEIATCIANRKGELLKAKEDAELREIARIERKASPQEKQRIKLLVKITALIGTIIIIAPFIITGFVFNIIWYLLIIALVGAVLMTILTDGNEKDDLHFVLKILLFIIVCGLIMFLWGPINPNY